MQVIYLIWIDILIKLLMLSPVLIKFIFYIFDILSDIVMSFIWRLLERSQLFLELLMNLKLK